VGSSVRLRPKTDLTPVAILAHEMVSIARYLHKVRDACSTFSGGVLTGQDEEVIAPLYTLLQRAVGPGVFSGAHTAFLEVGGSDRSIWPFA
jgi:hypothetical protein